MIQELLKSIEKTIFAPYQCSVKGKKIVLTEDKPDATCKQITFQITGNALVYKFDREVKDNDNQRIKEPLLFLNETSPLRSKCDYLIFYTHTTKNRGEKLYVLICNMKSGNKGNMEDQLYSGNILADFLLQTAFRCHQFWYAQDNKNKFDADFQQFKRDYIIVKEIAIYSKAPVPKGNLKGQKSTKRKILQCDNNYELHAILC